MRNNIGFPNKNEDMDGVDAQFNTWNLSITEAAADFLTTSDTGCTGPREADGSLPKACTFLMPKSGSPLIDKGTNVMLPYGGAAPDLGAYEYSTTVSAGSGGLPSNGGGGSISTGGFGKLRLFLPPRVEHHAQRPRTAPARGRARAVHAKTMTVGSPPKREGRLGWEIIAGW